MPLFRQHRSTLKESLQTTVLVKDMHDLGLILSRISFFQGKGKKVKFRISPYPSPANCFDARCGWFTQIVTAEIEGGGVLGFLSEPMDD